ncbi:unnamed protein product [Ectocarpus sp. 12 AP-2014]
MKFEWAPSLLRWLPRVVGVESVLMACMGSVSSPPSAIQGSRQPERHQACEASSKREIRHMSRNKAALRPLVRSSAGRSLGGRRVMLALISVAHLNVVEGKSARCSRALTAKARQARGRMAAGRLRGVHETHHDRALVGLIEFPSGFRCMWNDLPHGLQFAILFLMLGILYGVNRLFDKADEAMYTRLTCATAGLLNERRQHRTHRIF